MTHIPCYFCEWTRSGAVDYPDIAPVVQYYRVKRNNRVYWYLVGVAGKCYKRRRPLKRLNRIKMFF